MSEADSSAHTQPWAAPTVHVQTTHHDCPVAHIELGLSGDQGLLVLLDDWGDPAKGVQVLDAGNTAGKRHQVTRWGKGRASLAARSGRPGCGETEGTVLLQVLTWFLPYPKGIANSTAFFKISRKHHLL